MADAVFWLVFEGGDTSDHRVVSAKRANRGWPRTYLLKASWPEHEVNGRGKVVAVGMASRRFQLLDVRLMDKPAVASGDFVFEQIVIDLSARPALLERAVSWLKARFA